MSTNGKSRIHTCIVILMKDLMAFGQRSKVATGMNRIMKADHERCYINDLFQNRGMNMIGSKRVMAALLKYLKGPPHIVS